MLRSGSSEDIIEMFNRMERECKNLIKSIIQLVYFMRGSVSYSEMMNMSPFERQLINEFIETRLETESKKVYPIY